MLHLFALLIQAGGTLALPPTPAGVQAGGTPTLPPTPAGAPAPMPAALLSVAWTPPLPPEPPVPDYPSCRFDWQSKTERLAKYASARSCYEAIGRYQQITLPPYLTAVQDYLDTVDAVRDAFKVTNPPDALRKLMDIQVKSAHDHYKPAAQDGSGYGPGFAKYRETLQRTQDDLAALREELTNIGQGG